MAYDADELLGLNIERIDQANREAVIIGKGGNAKPNASAGSSVFELRLLGAQP